MLSPSQPNILRSDKAVDQQKSDIQSRRFLHFTTRIRRTNDQ